MTVPFARPLLATEHTAFDVGAERVAFALAQRWAVPLAAVFPLVSNPEYESVAPAAVARAEREVAARIAGLRAQASGHGVPLDVRVRRDADLGRAIVDEAAARSADLVVIRRRGERGFLANLMVGEVARHVAVHAPCSVLLVPRAGELWSRRILAGVDGSASAHAVAATAASVARQDDAPLTLVGVAEHDTADARGKAQAAVDAAVSVAAASGVSAEVRMAAGRPHEALASLAGECGADLIVVGRSGETPAIKRRLLGGTARGVIGLSSGAVLVVHGAAA